MISVPKLDNSFSVAQFQMPGYSLLHRFDRNSNGDGILLHVKEDIPSKTLHVFKLLMEGFFELNMYKTKWWLCCIYNSQKKYISDALQEFRKNWMLSH